MGPIREATSDIDVKIVFNNAGFLVIKVAILNHLFILKTSINIILFPFVGFR